MIYLKNEINHLGFFVSDTLYILYLQYDKNNENMLAANVSLSLIARGIASFQSSRA